MSELTTSSDEAIREALAERERIIAELAERERTLVAEREAMLAERDALIASLRELVRSLEGKNGALESALVNHAAEIELLTRKLFGTKSERMGTNELQLLLGNLLADVKPLQQELEAASKNAGGSKDDSEPQKPADKPRAKPKGRRDLSVSKLPKVVVEITDPELAAQGRVIDHDESRQLIYVRGGFRVLVKRTAKYEVTVGDDKTVLGAEQPKTLFPRALCHTSVIAWIAHQKFAMGVPHHRLEQHLETEAEPLDRGTMCRYVEELGGILGSTIVEAMFEHARATCHVLSTDATGAAIQPEPCDGKSRQACKKGHFFTIVADCDHVLFHYASSHTSGVVKQLFHGFLGYLQSDASSVYDVLERGPPRPDDQSLTLVGCWAHCRRYFFDAAVCKYRVGVEGLERIREIYRAEATLASLPPAQRKLRRRALVAPLIDAFFVWVAAARAMEAGRSLATKALGYATNQEDELRRVLLDGRLPLDNTRSERALRKVVVGRKNWMFYGSDTHAESAAAIFSIIASCRLHKLDALDYLTDVLRVLPHWPRDRFIELAPLNWRATRERLDPDALAKPIGVVPVPARVVA